MKRRARRRQVHLVHRGRTNRAGRKAFKMAGRARSKQIDAIVAAVGMLRLPAAKAYALHYNPNDNLTESALAAAELAGIEKLADRGVVVAIHVPRVPTPFHPPGSVSMVERVGLDYVMPAPPVELCVPPWMLTT